MPRIARILRCQEGRWEPKRPALVPRERGNDDDLVPTKPPPSSQGLYEQLNEPGDGGLSSSSRDRRSCSSTPKTCDHACVGCPAAGARAGAASTLSLLWAECSYTSAIVAQSISSRSSGKSPVHPSK